MPSAVLLLTMIPLAALGFIVGGIGTRGLLAAQSRQVSPARTTWITWTSGWSIALVALAVIIVVVLIQVLAVA